LATVVDTSRAIRNACREVVAQLQAKATLAVLFASHHHESAFDTLATSVLEHTGAESLIGCTGEAIVGGDREIEGQPALALWLAYLPGAQIHAMHLTFEQTPEGLSFLGWPDELLDADNWAATAGMLVLGDPFSFPADQFLSRMNEDHPGVPVIGGMASGARMPGQNRLWLDGDSIHEGAVALLLRGPLRLRTVVSQGCRPIGRPFVVTKAHLNIILELGGQPALKVVKDLFESLPAHDQALMQQGLHVGRVINELQDRFERGDFLVRNVIGADPESGAIALGDMVRAGQTVQFHVRDADSADEDLRALLSASNALGGAPPVGALLFTCNGRGTRLFRSADHDARTLREHAGDIPTAGFFAQGELGPIGRRNFIHGFTASIALFETA
jgi:small ligand-binding sensory domain FIST